MRVLKTAPGWITDVAFSPDCRAVACAMHGPVIFLWNLDSPTIAPERLHEIRKERRPDSRYAALDNCRYEVQEAETLMRREGIHSINSTTKSIEEIATTILRELRIQRQVY